MEQGALVRPLTIHEVPVGLAGSPPGPAARDAAGAGARLSERDSKAAGTTEITEWARRSRQ